MTEQEILDGNLMIAHFMNYVKEEPEPDFFMWKRLPDNAISFRKLTFDTNWSELIPVVQKIESLPDCKARVAIERSECRVYAQIGNSLLVRQEDEKDKIKSTYLTVINFIKWYNNERDKNK